MESCATFCHPLDAPIPQHGVESCRSWHSAGTTSLMIFPLSHFLTSSCGASRTQTHLMGFCRVAQLSRRCMGSRWAGRDGFRKLVWSCCHKMGEDTRPDPLRGGFERPFLMSCPNPGCSAPRSSPGNHSTSVCMSPALLKMFSPELFLPSPCLHPHFVLHFYIYPAQPCPANPPWPSGSAGHPAAEQ